MTKILYLFIFAICTISLSGQTKSIIDDLNTDKVNQGKVRILQDESIDKLLGVHHTLVNSSLWTTNSDNPMIMGWKIQVFSGNNQQTSKGEAENRRRQVRSAFPDLDAALIYSAPMWRLRVGSFVNREEAEEKLSEMKRILPGLAREMYIVQEAVKNPAYKPK